MVALTGVFIASAQSIADQRLRTAATRVATDHLETLRGLAFDQLDGEAGVTTVTTPDGRTFTINTAIIFVDAVTGVASPDGRVKQITATVFWGSGGAVRQVAYTTGVAPPRSDTGASPRAISTVIMFPNPAVTDVAGRPLADVEVTVPLEGFVLGTLAHLSWVNADGSAGGQTLTSLNGVNWRATIPKEQIRASLDAAGQGEVEFTVAAGDLSAIYTLAAQAAPETPPTISGATIVPNPIVVARPTGSRTCADTNQCQNTTGVTFTVSATGLDPAQDSIIVQYQLHDGTFQELPFTPPGVAGGQWLLTVRQKTTKFLTGIGRPFRVSAIRTSDDATATVTVLRDVITA